jgi:NADPH:quinone reductase
MSAEALSREPSPDGTHVPERRVAVVFEVGTHRPRRGQLLIRILAEPRSPAGPRPASPTVREADITGVVEDIGPGATRFARGDRVFGQLVIPPRGLFTSRAEAIVVSEDAPLAALPPGLDPMVAATLPTAAGTALDIVDLLEPLHGKTLLIVGDGDGIGSFATQFAANEGAHVIAQARPDDADRMRAYGAAETVDGSLPELMDTVSARHPDGIDALIDLASDAAAFADLVPLLRSWGAAVSTRNAADPFALATAAVIGVNHALTLSAELLRRVGEAIAARRVFAPPMAGAQLAAAA